METTEEVKMSEVIQAQENIMRSFSDVFFLYSQEENEEDEKTLLKYINQLETYIKKIHLNKEKLVKEMLQDGSIYWSKKVDKIDKV